MLTSWQSFSIRFLLQYKKLLSCLKGTNSMRDAVNYMNALDSTIKQWVFCLKTSSTVWHLMFSEDMLTRYVLILRHLISCSSFLGNNVWVVLYESPWFISQLYILSEELIQICSRKLLETKQTDRHIETKSDAVVKILNSICSHG
jgi:hypothetical protein